MLFSINTWIIGGNSERARPLKTQLDELGLTYKDIDCLYLESTPEFHNKERAAATYGRESSLGELGCATNHRLAYQRLISENLQWGVILEDDARIPNTLDFMKALQAIDYVMKKEEPRVVSFYGQMVGLTSTSDSNLFECLNIPNGTVAYAINRPAAGFLYKANQDLRYRADWPLGTPVRFYLWRPQLIEHGDGNSLSVIGERVSDPIYKAINAKSFSYRAFWNRLKRYTLFSYFKDDFKFFDSPRDYWVSCVQNRFLWQLSRLSGRRVDPSALNHFYVPVLLHKIFKSLFYKTTN